MKTERLLRGAVVFLLLPLLLITSTGERRVEAASAPDDRHAINLASYKNPVDPAVVDRVDVPEGRVLYSTTAMVGGSIWYRLRLGFFASSKEASAAMEGLRDGFPEAWVTKVTAEERQKAPSLALAPFPEAPEITEAPEAPVPAPEPVPAPAPIRAPQAPAPPAAPVEEPSAAAETTATEDGEAPAPEPSEAERLMEEAGNAAARGEYPRAIELYKEAMKVGSGEDKRLAHEFLGAAYEKNGSLEQAGAEYRTYLFLYPEGEGSERVRQRLAGIETATAAPRKRLREAEEESDVETEVYGSFSQFYNRDENFTDLGGNVVTRSTLSTDMDVTVRRRTPDRETTMVAIGGYELDLLDVSESDARLSRLYLDYLDRKRDFSFRVGRQSQSTGGVLGLFDGARAGYQIHPLVRLNVVAGLPADTSRIESLDPDRRFQGVNLDIGTFADSLDLNVFFIDQVAEGLIDRRAVGGEVRYFHPNFSFFALVDYDIFFDELASAFFTGNAIFSDSTVVSFSADWRKSPALSTTNALLGRGEGSLSEMLETLTPDEVKELARDRTAESRSVTVAVTHPLSEKLQLGGDVTVSELTGTPSSGGVAATPATGYDVFTNIQLIGSSLIKTGDLAIIGVGYSDTSLSNTVTFNLNTRYPVNRDFRVNPRLRLDLRDNESGTESLSVRPSLRVEYYLKRRFKVEFDGGADWNFERRATGTETVLNYFVSIGYRLEFF